MPSDPIQHLRELMAHPAVDLPPWRQSSAGWTIYKGPGRNRVATCDGAKNAALIVAAIPALLDVAEAAREMRKVQRQRAYDASACAAGRNYSEATQVSLEQDCDC